MAKDSPQAKYSEQYILNNIYDQVAKAISVIGMGADGTTGGQLNLGDSMAIKLTEDGTTTYIGFAAPGSAQSASVWQCRKLDESSGLVITYADGNAEFDNVATDLSALSYS